MNNISPSVAICALVEQTIPPASKLCEFDETWTINNTHSRHGLKTDLIIAMDDLERDEETHPDYVDAIIGAGVPVLSTEPKKRWPSVEAFPLQEVCNFISPYFHEPWRVLDNSVNYAFALALARGYKNIGIFGVDFCAPYTDADLACSLVRFDDMGYPNAPDWFKYYHPSILTPRRPRKPGIESFHFLYGLAMGLGRQLHMSSKTTLLNYDRDKFFYGYQKQPNVKL